MYIRFKTDDRFDGSIVYRVQIYQSFRCPITAQPRGKMIKHVASIAAKDCDNKMMAWRFWNRLENCLAKLTISETEKDSIRRSAERRVPRSRLPVASPTI